MDERRNRFLNLEPLRPPSSPDHPAPQSEVSLPAALQEQRRAQLESGLVLDPHPDDEQPFVRCGQCETDGLRGATQCRTCGADLQTPEQRAFNQQLWTNRRQEREREKQELAQHAQEIAQHAHEPHVGTLRGPLADDSSSAEAQQRALGQALAAEVKERESMRLGWMAQPRNSLRNLDSRSSFARSLLERVPDPLLRFLASLGLLALASGFLWELFFRPDQSHPVAWGGLVLLVFLFLPLRNRDDGDE
jgi:hypothetical protein